MGKQTPAQPKMVNVSQEHVHVLPAGQLAGLVIFVIGLLGAVAFFLYDDLKSDLDELISSHRTQEIKLVELETLMKAGESRAAFKETPIMQRAGLDFKTFDPNSDKLNFGPGLNFPVLAKAVDGNPETTFAMWEESPFFDKDTNSWPAVYCKAPAKADITTFDTLAGVCAAVPPTSEAVRAILNSPKSGPVASLEDIFQNFEKQNISCPTCVPFDSKFNNKE